MLLVVYSALFFAVLLAIVVVPTLYLFNPDEYPGESLGPPSAGQITTADTVSHSVRQKIYLLFIIPFCGVLNAAFIYLIYYRPLRHTQFRIEQNCFSAELTSRTGIFCLRNSAVYVEDEETRQAWNNIFRHAEQHAGGPLSLRYLERMPNDHSPADGGTVIASGQKTHRTRPFNVRKDRYTTWAMSREVAELREVLEQNCITPANVAEKNYQLVVDQLIDPRILGQATQDCYASSVTQTASRWPQGRRVRPPKVDILSGSDSRNRRAGAMVVVADGAIGFGASGSSSKDDEELIDISPPRRRGENMPY